MNKIRVLVVDDSVVIRRIVADTLAEDPLLQIAGVAANGLIALARIEQVAPDAVTLDVEMPEMDGIETLKAIRATRPKLPVIMFSTLTERGAEATIDSLVNGASDYVTKPSNVGNVTVAKQRIREQLVPKIKGLCRLGRIECTRPRPLPIQTRPALRRSSDSGELKVIAIGSSTGGPNALAEVLPQLPADLAVPVLVVQHMPPTFTRFLAERLDSTCQLKVREAVPGQLLTPGCAWIAAGDFHMTVQREAAGVVLGCNQAPPENSCRPSVDVLFRSVAEVYAGSALGIVLTGMGQDGLRGSERLCHAGAQIVVQDEATSVVWGMPGFVAKANLADKVLPLQQIGPEILRRVSTSRGIRSLAQASLQ